MIKTIKKNAIMFISLLLVIVCGFVYCSADFLHAKQTTEIQPVTRNIEINKNGVDYQSILDEFDDANLQTEGTLTTFEGYKSINLAELDGFDLVSDSDVDDAETNVKYNFSYDNETNIVTLSAQLKDEFGEIHVDTLTGAAFINDDGEIDAVMNVDGEGILLSEMQNAGMIQNCGWFSRFIKKVVKIVAVAVAVGVVVTTAVATAGAIVSVVAAAAPAVVAAGVGAVGAGASAGIAAGAAINAGIAAAAITAGVGLGWAIGETIVEGINGSMTINHTYTIGEEKVDKATKDIVRIIAKTATITSLREMTRAYHIAFAVCQKFSEGGTTYSVGDLYISKQALTFDEAYAVLYAAGFINSIEKLTSNNDIIDAIKDILANNPFGELIDLLKGYKKNGYLAQRALGIYADSVEAAATLAVVTGAWINNGDTELFGYGGAGGYYHFHNIERTIHIWYGSKIK